MCRAISDSAARTLPSRVPEFLAGWKTLAESAFVDMSTIKYRQWVQTDVPGRSALTRRAHKGSDRAPQRVTAHVR